MKHLPAFTMCILLFMVSACGEKQTTPPEVEEAYLQLKSELDDDTIGESIDQLDKFRKEHKDYFIAVTAKEEIDRLRGQAAGRCNSARELAREGELERAEKILTDLTTYLPDTDDGEQAERYMRFDFHMFKATRLMMDGRFDEAELALREVMSHDLNLQESEQADRLLDGLTNARRGQAISRVQSLKGACQQLRVLLMRYRAENGAFPGKLTLHSLDLGDSASERSIRKHLSAIEGYRVTKGGFSLTAIGQDSETRFLVSQDGVDPD